MFLNSPRVSPFGQPSLMTPRLVSNNVPSAVDGSHVGKCNLQRSVDCDVVFSETHSLEHKLLLLFECSVYQCLLMICRGICR